MKSKEVLWFLTLLCAIALVMEVSRSVGQVFGPIWFTMTGGFREWHRLVILVLGILLLQPLYKQGHRWSLVPIVIAIAVLNPPADWRLPFRTIWQPWALGMVVFAAYLPDVRSLTARLWRE
ncbi:MAG: hypothetical protein EOP88_17510 [Verrucomicrobiaceae bacterium]|nr:MAG: hypothetical protein EOP88_17510 [Verrucomicrobiaceae bacterium]